MAAVRISLLSRSSITCRRSLRVRHSGICFERHRTLSACLAHFALWEINMQSGKTGAKDEAGAGTHENPLPVSSEHLQHHCVRLLRVCTRVCFEHRTHDGLLRTSIRTRIRQIHGDICHARPVSGHLHERTSSRLLGFLVRPSEDRSAGSPGDTCASTPRGSSAWFMARRIAAFRWEWSVYGKRGHVAAGAVCRGQAPATPPLRDSSECAH